MKLFQVLLTLCFFILMNCSSRSILLCAIDNISSGLTDEFMKRFNSSPDKAYSYFNGNQAAVTKAIKGCK